MDRVKRGELPSATQRMYTPARQSACCSATSVGVLFLFSLACFWIAWPYSWASTIVMAMSPLACPQRGQQHTAVPADGVVVVAEAGVDQSVGVVAAELLPS